MPEKPSVLIIGSENPIAEQLLKRAEPQGVVIVDARDLLGPKFNMDFDPALIRLDVARRHGMGSEFFTDPKPTMTPDQETELFLAESFDAMFPTKTPKKHLGLLKQRDVVVGELTKKLKKQRKRRKKKK